MPILNISKFEYFMMQWSMEATKNKTKIEISEKVTPSLKAIRGGDFDISNSAMKQYDQVDLWLIFSYMWKKHPNHTLNSS